ncbi:MAG: hypothetical protein A2508_01470 [Candidatus Lambdaproteobacteria bacterium RIFOXYD12_FULL_49_8]|nr:MAG: hypothetical protein A2508_01470 [Candidatus Lambdaproteobacteria bacterium RIFOXYD12_FULL_49_8]
MGLLTACTAHAPDPRRLEITQLDQEQTTFPPSEVELVYQPALMVLLLEEKDPIKPLEQSDLVTLALVSDQLAAQAGLVQVPRTQIQAVLKDQKWRNLRPESIMEALEFGKSMGAQFVGQLRVQTQAERQVQFWLKVIKVDTGQLVFSETFKFLPDKQDRIIENLKPVLQAHFPIIGWVLQTRGDREMVHISLGTAEGVKPGRPVVFRSRRIERGLEEGVNTGRIEYSEILAKGKVTESGTEGSWVWVEEAGRGKLRWGDLVFTAPESKGNFF